MHAPTSSHRGQPTGPLAETGLGLGWQAEEWRMHLQGMQALAQLAQGRRGEEGMRRHYLALMQACSESMTQLMAAAPRAAAESSRS